MSSCLLSTYRRLTAQLILPILVVMASQTAIVATSVRAEEPISVQLLTSHGEYYKALLTYEQLPKRKITTDSTVAAARAAWALSLHGKASELFDQALESPSLSKIDRARIYLSRGIIEYQEEHYQMASLLGKRAVEQIEIAGPLRAKARLLVGQSLEALKNYGEAYEVLNQAVGESDGDDEGEIHYALGLASFQLNRVTEAEENFKKIPYGHDRTAASIRKLAEINLILNQPEKTKFWIEKGKAEYPDQFIDSWVQYALVESAVKMHDFETMRALQVQANHQYAPSDFWVGLINAATENQEWIIRKGVMS